MKTQPTERFWASTRGRIVTLLRGSDRTVSELAEALKVTDNAVRAHLTALERDDLVRQAGSRKGPRKPNLIYALTPAAGLLFPREYAVILGHLLAEVKARHPPEAITELVRAVGRRMAPAYRSAVAGTTKDRPGQALAVLRDLGGFCRSEERDGAAVLSCSDCPLAAVATEHPEVCGLVETVLADTLGVAVMEHCKPPHCLFEITAAVDHAGE